MKKLLLSIAAASLAAVSCTPKQEKTTGINYAYMDTTARPGDDFAKYATAHWAEYNPQPKEYPSWGAFEKLGEENTYNLAALIQDIASRKNKKGTIEQKIGDLYNMVMDSVRLNAEGAAPLKAHLAELDGIDSREALLKYCATEHSDLMFRMGVGPDDKDADNNIVSIGQGGLTLGVRDYYLSVDPETVKFREATKEHMKNLFVLAGFPEEEAVAKTARIWEIETELAEAHYTKEKRRIPEENYHKVTVEELNEMCAPFDWNTYLKDYRYDKTTEVDLKQPEPVVKGCQMLMSLPLEDLKSLCQWGIINGCTMLLSDEFTQEMQDYNNKVYGTEEMTPRWKRAVGMVDNTMSDAVGQMYVKKYFPKEAKKEMLELVGNLQKALGERFKAQEWMTDETKKLALEKLNAFTVKIGYPDKWDDLSGLVIDPEKPLYENMRKAYEFLWNLDYEKHYNKPVDKTEWLMSPQTVNAYYSKSTNEICFPAAILQPPFFNVNADAAANYGAIGVVIGHEMTHGFDSRGRLYTKEGNLENWWTEEDETAFKKPCDAMVNYFNGLWVIPDELHANGVLTLEENIADHGGLNVAYNAFQTWQEKHGRLKDVDGFTPEQRFFLSYANVWAGSATPEILRYYTMIDVHSVSFLRVNGGLAQCDYWYDAFDIQPGDALYVAPENRVKVW
ncbi:MAG: M13 family metallopeptidase [Bacteroidales bacterium]|nr:M13 family metallopeptidase [Bacteroidales bacterium]